MTKTMIKKSLRAYISIGMKKRPDSMKRFERKKHGIQLHYDNFRTDCQTGPVLSVGFF